MTITPSTMLPLGTTLPSFALTQINTLGLKDTPTVIRDSDLSLQPLLLMELCAHCPFVKHVEVELTRLYQDYGKQVWFLAVSSNSLETHPQDSPKYLAEQAKRNSWDFPYLLDSDQQLARALQAACTPDFFLFSPDDNNHQRLRYRGQLDDSRPGNSRSLTGTDLRRALDAVLAGAEICIDQKPSIGCNIKWHPGREPNWFNKRS